jgi:fatty acid desaturase
MTREGAIMLPAERSRALHRPSTTGLVRLAAFAAIYVLAVAWIVLIEPSRGTLWALACVPAYVAAAASLHGISLFTHEAVHGVLSPNRVLNRLLGAVCAWPVLQNCSAYRVLHLKHHAHVGQAGDPDHYDNYTRLRPLVFAMHWGRLLLGYPAYIVAIPILGFLRGSAADRVAIVAELMAVGGLLTMVLRMELPTWALVHSWLIPMLVINTMVNIRGMSQHTLLEHESDPIRGTRTILTNRVTQWFMCNENFHLEHHLFPGVPWYHLPALHEELKGDLMARGAPFVASYAEFAADFVSATLTARSRRTVTMPPGG